eukprot:3038407-Pleurochrysis_carterae.AAC.1
MSAHDSEENQSTLVRIALNFFAHHLGHDSIHGLAALLEDVCDRVLVRACRLVVGLVVSAQKMSGLARCIGPVVHRRCRGEAEHTRLQGLGDANIAKKRCCRLAQQLLERLRLRLRSLALEHGQFERRRLQVAVGVVAGEQLGE